jgi:hypothetical protein
MSLAHRFLLPQDKEAIFRQNEKIRSMARSFIGDGRGSFIM